MTERTVLFSVLLFTALAAVALLLERPVMIYDPARGAKYGCLYYVVENPKNGAPMKVACDKVTHVDHWIARTIPAQ